MPEIRKIDVELDKRVETGPTQIGDDWPGVFIRGDNAAYYAMNLHNLLNGNEDPFTRAVLNGLLSDLKGCIVR
jgi:hypothetical protein